MSDEEAAHIHAHLLETEGWSSDRAKFAPGQLDELLRLVEGKVPPEQLNHLRTYLSNTFADAVSIQRIGKPMGKKPATHVRDVIDALVSDLRRVQSRLERLDPLLRRYLDFRVTSLSVRVTSDEGSPSIDSVVDELGERITLLITICERAKPETQAGTETGWAFSATKLAELLVSATGEKLGRSYNARKNAEDAWHLGFFQRFAEIVQEQLGPEAGPQSWGSNSFSGIWRTACESTNHG